MGVLEKLINKASRLQNSIICYWTPLKWSPKSDKLAFFVSYANSKSSYLVVLNLTEPDKYKISGVDSIEDELINRKIEWPNSNTILSTYSDKDFNIITVNQCIIIQ